MSTDREWADDLLVLARRGELAEAEQRKLNARLTGSAEARLLHGAGRMFDLDGAIAPGDDTRIELVARRVEKRTRRAVPRGVVQRVLLPMLAGALITGVVFGAIELWRMHSRAQAPMPSARVTASTPVNAAPSVKTEVIGEPAPSSAAITNSTTLPILSQHSRAAASGATVLTEPPVSAADSGTARFADADPDASASSLFAAANRARMAGDSAAAVSLYQKLELTFPSSGEAQTAHLSLGLLALQQGRASQALTEFRAYRSSVAPGPTLAEALWGEARALRSLGRDEEERAALTQLVTQYPHSAYVPGAQKRLLELN